MATPPLSHCGGWLTFVEQKLEDLCNLSCASSTNYKWQRAIPLHPTFLQFLRPIGRVMGQQPSSCPRRISVKFDIGDVYTNMSKTFKFG